MKICECSGDLQLKQALFKCHLYFPHFFSIRNISSVILSFSSSISTILKTWTCPHLKDLCNRNIFKECILKFQRTSYIMCRQTDLKYTWTLYLRFSVFNPSEIAVLGKILHIFTSFTHAFSNFFEIHLFHAIFFKKSYKKLKLFFFLNLVFHLAQDLE